MALLIRSIVHLFSRCIISMFVSIILPHWRHFSSPFHEIGYLSPSSTSLFSVRSAANLSPFFFREKRNFANHRNVSSPFSLNWGGWDKKWIRSDNNLTHFDLFLLCSAMAWDIPTRTIAAGEWWSAHRRSTVADKADRGLSRWVIGTILWSFFPPHPLSFSF